MRVTITIIAEVANGTDEDRIHRAASAAFVQVNEPGDDSDDWFDVLDADYLVEIERA